MKRLTWSAWRIRPVGVRLHRWAGLYMALFLTVAGLTGSILAFAEPIDRWLNPELQRVAVTGPRLDPFRLYEMALRHAPDQVRLDAVNLGSEEGRPVGYLATARTDPSTGRAFEHTVREITLNPYTGELLHIRRLDEALFPITRSNLIALVFQLHSRLALPGSIGTWLFGIAGLLWTVDCFVGAWLTFPQRRSASAKPATRPSGWWRRWQPAWRLRWRAGFYRLTFDLHRAGGLWVWLMLLVFAWSSVGLNLGEQIYKPVMNTIFDMHRTGESLPTLAAPQVRPVLSFREARDRGRALARAQSAARGFTVGHELEVSFDSERGLYRYAFKSSSDIGRYGNASVLLDADSGALRAVDLQDGQPVGVQISDWLFALHFGAVGGLPMQIFVCMMGALVAILSVTGVVIWWKKYRGHRRGRLAGAAARGRR